MDYTPFKDTKVKHYIDDNVYNQAIKRIKEVISITDDRIVLFSGGKDSLAVLNLVQEVYDELGITEKVKVAFFDEEIIPQEVIDFVTEIYKSKKYDFRYYAIPLASQKHLLGQTFSYTQFDPNREWVRQPPKFAITLENSKIRFNEHTVDRDKFTCADLKGKVAMFKGLRADESSFRLNACTSKPNKTYINKTGFSHIISVKPIYDWTENDVFLYFYKNNIKYCSTYDKQMWNNQILRVATPFLAEGRKSFHKVKTYNDDFFDKILKVFPEMVLQDKYGKDYVGVKYDFSKYSHNIRGLYQFIDDTITDKQQNQHCKTNIKRALSTRKHRKNDIDKFGGYPLYELFKKVSNGGYKRNIPPKIKCTLKDYLFEGYTEQDYVNYLNYINRYRAV